jgi:hypothetical protein
MIALGLGIEVNEIDSSFWRNVFTTSGGMPHYLSYVLETIKRNDLTVKLDNGLFGLKSSEGDDSKVGFSSFIFPCLLPIFLFATPSHITLLSI